MNLDGKVKLSETRIFKAVLPNTINYYDTFFGGTATHLTDEIAFITATRFTTIAKNKKIKNKYDEKLIKTVSNCD